MEFSTSTVVLIILAILILLLIAWVIATYNRFVHLREDVRNAMGQIATQIESRWDALTSVIAAAKQYAQHEAETLLEVTQRRTPLRPDSTPADVANDDQTFAGTCIKRAASTSTRQR